MPEEQNQVVNSTPKFNTHKVFAAIGIILTATIIILGGIWWYIDRNSVDEVEDMTVKVSTTSAQPATNSATTSAE